MPPLEEGNLWIRATLPQDISFDTAAKIGRRAAGTVIAESPEVTQTVSQMGRPDDGTDVCHLQQRRNLRRSQAARASGAPA